MPHLLPSNSRQGWFLSHIPFPTMRFAHRTSASRWEEIRLPEHGVGMSRQRHDRRSRCCPVHTSRNRHILRIDIRVQQDLIASERCDPPALMIDSLDRQQHVRPPAIRTPGPPRPQPPPNHQPRRGESAPPGPHRVHADPHLHRDRGVGPPAGGQQHDPGSDLVPIRGLLTPGTPGQNPPYRTGHPHGARQDHGRRCRTHIMINHG